LLSLLRELWDFLELSGNPGESPPEPSPMVLVRTFLSVRERSEGGTVSALLTTIGATLLGIWAAEAVFFLAGMRAVAKEENAHDNGPLLRPEQRYG